MLAIRRVPPQDCTRKAIVEVEVASAKSDGRSWDPTGGAPDTAGTLYIGNASYDLPRKEDAYSVRHELCGATVNNGDLISVELSDKDITNHDLIGSGKATYNGQTPLVIQAGQAKVSLTFK